MPSRLPLVAFTTLGVIAAACSAPPPEDDSTLSDAELSAMVPGVDESALDRSVNPCTDFYEFACRGYLTSLPPDTADEWRSFSALRRERDEVMKQVVDDVLHTPRTTAEKKASLYLQNCRTKSTPESARVFATEWVAKISRATTPAARDELLGELLRAGVAPFFWIGGTDDTLRLGRHGSVMAAPAGFDSWGTDYSTDSGIATRTQRIAALLQTFEPDLTESEAARLARGAVDIEATLAKAGAGAFGASGHPVGKLGLAAVAPGVDWDSVLRALHAPANIGDFNVPSLEYFGVVDQVLRSATPEMVAAHIKSALYESYEPPPPAAIDETCSNAGFYVFGDALEPRFLLYAGVDAAAQRKARGMFAATVDAFTENLASNAFLDLPTRIEAQVKAAKVRAAIGSSRELDDYSDVTIDPEAPFAANGARLAARYVDLSFHKNGRRLPLEDIDGPANTVNAWYNGQRNTITIPGGILGGYFFSPKASAIANFAGIGTTLAHEVSHGFDDNGRLSDGDGVSRDWWTPASAAAFAEKSQCLVDQYETFPVEEVTDPKTGAHPHVNGKQTLSENIADTGIRIAYRASKVEDRTGPVVAGFTPQQQFFVGYAQLWCAKRSAESAADRLSWDSHSPPKARVNIPLSNFDAFEKAFACAPGSAMAPKNRCTMW